MNTLRNFHKRNFCQVTSFLQKPTKKKPPRLAERFFRHSTEQNKHVPLKIILLVFQLRQKLLDDPAVQRMP